jgi:hypothetical protein
MDCTGVTLTGDLTGLGAEVDSLATDLSCWRHSDSLQIFSNYCGTANFKLHFAEQVNRPFTNPPKKKN